MCTPQAVSVALKKRRERQAPEAVPPTPPPPPTSAPLEQQRAMPNPPSRVTRRRSRTLKSPFASRRALSMSIPRRY